MLAVCNRLEEMSERTVRLFRRKIDEFVATPPTPARTSNRIQAPRAPLDVECVGGRAPVPRPRNRSAAR
jgi:hypothetical protein